MFLITGGGGQVALKALPGVPGPGCECLVSAQWKGIYDSREEVILFRWDLTTQ